METKDSNQTYQAARQSCVICNSCRYCEGLCAVFPAMEKNREFSLQDIDYLANLCHQCSECFYDCQYAPPHEFDVSIPAQFAAVRKQSYKKYAFLGILAKAFDKNALVTSLILIVALFLGFVASSFFKADTNAVNGDFYKIIPYEYIVSVFSVVGILVLVCLVISLVRYARAIQMPAISLKTFIQSCKDVLSLKYLGGHNNEGCTYPNIQRSNVRKYFHHLTAYGFLFCFIATSLAAFYAHFLHLQAPYEPTALPKLFGIIGGIMLCIGVAGLFVLKLKADKEIKDISSLDMDYAFLCMLFIVSASGLVLMLLRQSTFLAPLLWFHLSCVLAFFVMIPYSKFVHLFYRFLSLLKYNATKDE